MAVNAEFTRFISRTGPLASLMRVYQWQLWRPESLESSKMVVIDANNVTRVQPDNAVKSTLQVANTQASTPSISVLKGCRGLTGCRVVRRAFTHGP